MRDVARENRPGTKVHHQAKFYRVDGRKSWREKHSQPASFVRCMSHAMTDTEE